MAATNQDLKDFFALTGNNPPVSNAQLQDLADWLSEHAGIETPTANDVVDFVYKTFREQIVAFKRRRVNQTW